MLGSSHRVVGIVLWAGIEAHGPCRFVSQSDAKRDGRPENIPWMECEKLFSTPQYGLEDLVGEGRPLVVTAATRVPSLLEQKDEGPIRPCVRSGPGRKRREKRPAIKRSSSALGITHDPDSERRERKAQGGDRRRVQEPAERGQPRVRGKKQPIPPFRIHRQEARLLQGSCDGRQVGHRRARPTKCGGQVR